MDARDPFQPTNLQDTPPDPPDHADQPGPDVVPQPADQSPVGATGLPHAASGAPAMSGPSHESYVPQSPESGGTNKVLIGIAACGLLLALVGAIRAMVTEPKEPEPRQRVESIWSEQQRLARDAMQMAREAQQMQRERMQQMNRAMEAEMGYYEEDPLGDR